MRITGGIYRGRQIEAPKDKAVRPTSDKVRLAVFNMLEARSAVADASVLDAFCGTGALGIEALSRGALCCTFIDKNRGSLELCRRNFAALKIDEQHSFILKDASVAGVCPAGIKPASLVFLDPPYREGLVEAGYLSLQQGGWIAQSAIVVIEAEKEWKAETIAQGGTEIIQMKQYGDTCITLARAPC
jgi:16S rRNA (guanine966-N2)-methyltransferase